MFDRGYSIYNDDSDIYMDDIEKLELGQCKYLVKDELYMPVHPSRNWVKCYVTSTEEHGFRMYLEGNTKRFLLSAKTFGNGKYLISSYESYASLENKPKSGSIARLERQDDESFLLCLDYCHLCDHKLCKFCCGRGTTEREVITRIFHSVKKYKKINMEFRRISVTLPKVSSSGTRKVWCPRSFKMVYSDIAASTNVNEAIKLYPKMSMKLISKLPEWNSEANNLVVKFEGSGRLLLASAKNFLLFEEKYALFDFAEQSTENNNTVGTMKLTSTSQQIGNNYHKHSIITTNNHSLSIKANDLEAISVPSPYISTSSPLILAGSSMKKSMNDSSLAANNNNNNINDNISSGSYRNKSSLIKNIILTPSNNETSIITKSSHRNDKYHSNSHSKSPDRIETSSISVNSIESNRKLRKLKSLDTKDKIENNIDENNSEPKAIMQFGKTSPSRYILDFKFPLSPLQAFGIALSTFAHDELKYNRS